MKLSMGPALALGLESRHEVFDVEGIALLSAPTPPRASTQSCPPASRSSRSARSRQGEPSLAKAVKGARYAVRLDSEEHRSRAERGRSPTAGAKPCRPCARSPSRPTPPARACASRSTSTRPPARPPRRRRSSRRCSRSLRRSRPAMSIVREATVLALMATASRSPPASRPRTTCIDYAGGPEPLHGHSYRVEAVLEAEKLQQYDLAVDFVPREEGPRGDRQGVRLRLHQRAPRLPRPQHVGREPAPDTSPRGWRPPAPSAGPGRRGHRLGRTGEPGHLPSRFAVDTLTRPDDVRRPPGLRRTIDSRARERGEAPSAPPGRPSRPRA